jgi:hypothetical protein
VQQFKTIKATIGRPYGDVYAFLQDVRNAALWGGIEPQAEITLLEDGASSVRSGGLTFTFRATPANAFGILDVDFQLPNAPDTWREFVRLTANLQGCDLVVCHVAPAGLSAEQFEAQSAWIETRLSRIKSHLEGELRLPDILNSTVISVGIRRPAALVMSYLTEPALFARWAALTSNRMVHKGDLDWLFDTAAGPRIVRFQAPNSFGIADQAVFAEGETPLVNPMRVVPNGNGTIVTYVCFQRPGTSEEKYQSTVEWITSDFLTLQSVIEA